jgi:single-strand DNA-binding protein
VNKVILVGNLGADPELRRTPGGQAVCNLRVATSERWKDRDGQARDRTEWHTVVVWGPQAETCARHLAKGRSVYVEGRLQSREYTDRDGQQRKVWDVVARNVVFLGGTKEGLRGRGHSPAGGGPGGVRYEPSSEVRPSGSWGVRSPTSRPGTDEGKRDRFEPTDGFEDDPIPF